MSLLNRITGTLTFNRFVIEEIKVSSPLSKESLLLLIIAWFCGALANLLSGGVVTLIPLPVAITNPLVEFFVSLAFQAFFTLTWFFLAAIIGNIVGQEASFIEITRCMGYAYIISALRLIPALMIFSGIVPEAATILNLLILVWALVNTIYVLIVALDCSEIFLAIIVAIIAVLIAAIVVFVVGLFVVPALGTGGLGL
ncbi:MAG: hypothetical protein ACFFC7_10680 [Candidatus Hermodarchaeota archaeon]